MSNQQKNTSSAVGLGIIVGAVITALTGDAIWTAIGIGVGAAIGSGVYQMGKG